MHSDKTKLSDGDLIQIDLQRLKQKNSHTTRNANLSCSTAGPRDTDTCADEVRLDVPYDCRIAGPGNMATKGTKSKAAAGPEAPGRETAASSPSSPAKIQPEEQQEEEEQQPPHGEQAEDDKDLLIAELRAQVARQGEEIAALQRTIEPLKVSQ